MTVHAILRICVPVALLTFLSVSPARAEDPVILATINDMTITQADYAAAEVELSQVIAQIPEAERRDYIISFLIDMKLMAQEARKRDMTSRSGFDLRMAFLRDRVLMQMLLAQEAGKDASDDDIKAFYETEILDAPREQEIRARHILVKTEEKAKEVAAEIATGADFAELARQHSTGPSGPKGGDLGFFGKGRMVPAFEAAAMALDVGGVSAPVKTQFGWHLIKVEEKRTVEPPAFEKVKSEIKTYLERQSQASFVQGLREAATIERAAPPSAE